MGKAGDNAVMWIFLFLAFVGMIISFISTSSIGNSKPVTLTPSSANALPAAGNFPNNIK